MFLITKVLPLKCLFWDQKYEKCRDVNIIFLFLISVGLLKKYDEHNSDSMLKEQNIKCGLKFFSGNYIHAGKLILISYAQIFDEKLCDVLNII